MTTNEILTAISDLSPDARKLLIDPWCAVDSYCDASDELEAAGLWLDSCQISEHERRCQGLAKSLESLEGKGVR